MVLLLIPRRDAHGRKEVEGGKAAGEDRSGTTV
jgi:hypothetical protein